MREREREGEEEVQDKKCPKAEQNCSVVYHKDHPLTGMATKPSTIYPSLLQEWLYIQCYYEVHVHVHVLYTCTCTHTIKY